METFTIKTAKGNEMTFGIRLKYDEVKHWRFIPMGIELEMIAETQFYHRKEVYNSVTDSRTIEQAVDDFCAKQNDFFGCYFRKWGFSKDIFF